MANATSIRIYYNSNIFFNDILYHRTIQCNMQGLEKIYSILIDICQYLHISYLL